MALDADQPDWIWMNGRCLPFAEASIGVEDRGFQFADGVYEVIRLYDGKPFTMAEHLTRLARSAREVAIELPASIESIGRAIQETIDEKSPGESMLYLQLTRGVAPRNHVYPAVVEPTLLFYTRPLAPPPAPGKAAGLKVLPVPDERWLRCDIKSIALLPNVMAKNRALAAGYDDAVFIDDGFITEASAANFFAVFDGTIVTAPLGPKILPGVTRDVLLRVARSAGMKVAEQPIAAETVPDADELFLTSTTREVIWVSHWGTQAVSATCGPVTKAVHAAFWKEREQATSRETVGSAG